MGWASGATSMTRTGGTENNPLVRPACFIKRIANEATDGTTVRLPPILLQPMAADDAARAVGRIAVGAPLNGTVEVAGHARYFGAELGDRSLIPAGEAPTRRDPPLDWLGQPVLQQRQQAAVLVGEGGALPRRHGARSSAH